MESIIFGHFKDCSRVLNLLIIFYVRSQILLLHLQQIKFHSLSRNLKAVVFSMLFTALLLYFQYCLQLLFTSSVCFANDPTCEKYIIFN